MRLATILFALLLATAPVWAVGPTTMTYQAVFTDAEGEIMADGVYNIGFHIFLAPVGGPPVWSEWQDVTVTNGIFEVTLGVIIPLSPAVFPQVGAWLGLSYDEDFLNPRQFITAVPYAFVSCWADTARSSANVGSLSEQELIDNVNQVDNHEARLDVAEACIDTLKEQIDSVRVGLIGGGGVAQGGVFSDSDDGGIVGESDEAFESGQFSVSTHSGIIYFAQVINDGLQHTSWSANLQIVTDQGVVVDETEYDFQATARTDLHVQKALPDLSSGTYFLRVVIDVNGGEVDIDEIEFGAMWIPTFDER